MKNEMLSDKIRILVINREKDTDRRQVMTERLNALGLRHEFFKAVDGHSFDAHGAPEYNGPKRRLHFGRDLSAGEIGCLLSHRGICQKMVTEDIPLALVLEDDTYFKPDFPDVLTSLLESDVEWDMVRFLNWNKIFRGAHSILSPLCGGYELARIQATPGGAYAYLMTNKAAKSMLAHTTRNWLPIDSLQGRGWQTGLNVLVTKPSPAAADFDVPSTIGDGRFEKKATVTGFTRLIYPLFRFWFKWENGLGKRIHFWQMSRKDKKIT